MFKREQFDDLGNELNQHACQRCQTRGDTSVLPVHILLGSTDLKAGPVHDLYSEADTIEKIRRFAVEGPQEQGRLFEPAISELTLRVYDSAYKTAKTVGLETASDIHIVHALFIHPDTAKEKGILQKSGLVFQRLEALIDESAYKPLKFSPEAAPRWYLPGAFMTLRQYVEAWGYTATEQRTSDDGTYVHWNVIKDGALICEVPVVDTRDKKSIPTIVYETSVFQIERAIGLRNLFRQCNLQYNENPLPTRMARQIASDHPEEAKRLIRA